MRDLVLTAKGKLVDAFIDTHTGTTAVRFDACDVTDGRDWPTDEERTLTTTLSTAIRMGQSVTRAHGHETTWGLDASGKLNQELGEKGVMSASSGAKLAGSFKDKVEDRLESLAEKSYEQVQSSTDERKLVVKANHVAAIRTTWEATVNRGRITGPDGEVVDYATIVDTGNPITEQGQYDSDQIKWKKEPRAPFWVVAALAELGVHAGHGSSEAAVFRKTGIDAWSEEPAVAGGGRFTFKETRREGASIDLFDASRNVTLSFDFRAQKIMYREGSNRSVPIYDIVKVGT